MASFNAQDGAFFFSGSSILTRDGGGLASPPDLAGEFPGSVTFRVSDLSGGTVACVDVPENAALPPGWKSEEVRRILPLVLEDSAGPLRAFHFAQWRRDSAFCGTCGGANRDSDDGTSRFCPACGRVEFPRITPAIIVLIENGSGEILLARNRKFAPGMYSLVAGFTEAGETLEQTVIREVREEVGLELADIRYEASQPWPFPASLMVGFSARYSGGEIRPDGVEIEDAGWFGPDGLPKLPGPGSVGRLLIDRWLGGQLRHTHSQK